MSDEERRESFSEEGGKPEAQVKMEADVKRRKEKAEEEWKEYEEMRKSEKEKESEEIRLLRERREQRKKERAAEEQRLAELRAVEEQKRRAEDEERQRRKRDEEQNRREEREIKNKEAEERSKITNRPNFIINKRSDDELISDEPTKEEVAKSKEQLEAERKAILEQRIQTLAIDGFDLQKLKEKAKELHQAIYKLESEKYDLEQQFQRQTLDLMELAERARQMNKGGKGQKVNVAQTDALPSKMSRAPPKVVMYSQYERVKDPRSFRDRSTVFDGPLYADYFTKIEARFKVQMGEQGAEVCGDAGSTPADSEVPMEA